MDDGLRELLTARNFVHLATTLPDGSAHSVPIWATVEEDRWLRQHFGEHALPRHVTPYVIRKHGIHVEDNLPVGSRFLIELPVAELTPASLADHNGSDATR